MFGIAQRLSIKNFHEGSIETWLYINGGLARKIMEAHNELFSNFLRNILATTANFPLATNYTQLIYYIYCRNLVYEGFFSDLAFPCHTHSLHQVTSVIWCFFKKMKWLM
jgi:hypothetical protein